MRWFRSGNFLEHFTSESFLICLDTTVVKRGGNSMDAPRPKVYSLQFVDSCALMAVSLEGGMLLVSLWWVEGSGDAQWNEYRVRICSTLFLRTAPVSCCRPRRHTLALYWTYPLPFGSPSYCLKVYRRQGLRNNAATNRPLTRNLQQTSTVPEHRTTPHIWWGRATGLSFYANSSFS